MTYLDSLLEQIEAVKGCSKKTQDGWVRGNARLHKKALSVLTEKEAQQYIEALTPEMRAIMSECGVFSER